MSNVNHEAVTYMTPLTNNERGLLLWIAGVRYRPLRNAADADYAIRNDLLEPYRGTSIPDAQRDRALDGLVAKGYVTLAPKMGNYWFRHNVHWGRWQNGLARPNHLVFRDKQRGAYPRVSWFDIAEITPVKDVAKMVENLRTAVQREQRERVIAAGDQVHDRQEKYVDAVLDACRRFIADYGDGREEPVVHPNDYPDADWYRLDETARDLTYAVEDLKRWASERTSVERKAAQARDVIAKAHAMVEG